MPIIAENSSFLWGVAAFCCHDSAEIVLNWAPLFAFGLDLVSTNMSIGRLSFCVMLHPYDNWSCILAFFLSIHALIARGNLSLLYFPLRFEKAPIGSLMSLKSIEVCSGLSSLVFSASHKHPVEWLSTRHINRSQFFLKGQFSHLSALFIYELLTSIIFLEYLIPASMH